jgi:hypothetical protein
VVSPVAHGRRLRQGDRCLHRAVGQSASQRCRREPDTPAPAGPGAAAQSDGLRLRAMIDALVDPEYRAGRAAWDMAADSDALPRVSLRFTRNSAIVAVAGTANPSSDGVAIIGAGAVIAAGSAQVGDTP